MERMTVRSLVTGLFLVVGCTGRIDPEGKQVAQEPPGQVPVNPSDPDRPPPDVAACSENLDPGAAFLRRLTNEEYDNTVADLLGYTGRASVDFGLLADTAATGFDTASETVTLSGPVFEKFERAASALATWWLQHEAAVVVTAGCKIESSGCLQTFVTNFGHRAFRRALTAVETEALLRLAAAGDDPRDAAALVLQGILLSPNFLFRPEVGYLDQGRVKLTGNELATRLSYALLRTTPSSELLARAESGELDTADGVLRIARDLQKTPRAKSAAKAFLTQWFRLKRVKGLRFETGKYAWSDDLAASMTIESEKMLEHFFWTEGQDFLGVLDARFSFVDERLARHYGIPAPVEPWGRVDFPPDSPRAGLMGQGSVLSLTSKPDHVSAILRGKFVRESILCSEIPSPPANVPPLSAPLPNESERERFARHTSDPACGGCHALLDPIGFGLSDFDAVGAIRTVDDLGRPVDNRGVIEGEAPVAFHGAVELAGLLRASPDSAMCASVHVLRYALGRNEDSQDDACALDALVASFGEAGNNLPELFAYFAASDLFRYRRSIVTGGIAP
jgi:Protein of unknown function (DUF1592)/Protein of unknown function (DUF1588)/Protein of unknown function (DUF1595)/Protein of unknown function (DUF1587)/Protein of unknown function (DUF1585)